MTDTEAKRREAICKVANINDIGDLSDGFHTFNQLYYQRMMLFAVIVKQNKGRAWKSLRHEDGELCFGGGWFVVGITTPRTTTKSSILTSLIAKHWNVASTGTVTQRKM